MTMQFEAREDFARHLDSQDPLASYRDRFALPVRPGGTEWLYLVGNSLGLMPRAARTIVNQELDDWEVHGVEAHFEGRTPWFSYHEVFRETGARLVGAMPGEVVMMNSLTVNLHLMLASFYRPVPGRGLIAIEDCAFPSDSYAVASHIEQRGLDASSNVLVIRPRPNEHLLRTEDIESLLEMRGAEIAVLMLSGVNYYTGQLFDLERIARAAQRQGCVVGFDLAHAAGNVELRLHDWGVDFAVWCSYKYLNAGPGAIGGCFVHQRHGANLAIPRLAGWWGNDPSTRFLMHENDRFIPRTGADGWQISNPPILSMAPLQASLALFDTVGMAALRAKSIALTGFLEFLIDTRVPTGITILTPRDIQARGCQLSLLVKGGARELFTRIQKAGVLCDYRHPDVIRVAPVPFYNSYQDVFRFGEILADAISKASPA
ncbi:MAG: kynureninase [Gemmatimonadota bacterium]